jgi:hypothetical protein
MDDGEWFVNELAAFETRPPHLRAAAVAEIPEN